MSETHRDVDFEFPLPRSLTGICLGNGVQGLMVWGDNTLNVTVARAGFWDHRCSSRALTGGTFSQLRDWLAAGDDAAVDAAFGRGAARSCPGPSKPYQIGGGRLVLRFADGLVPVSARWHLGRGRVCVSLARPGDAAPAGEVELIQSPGREVAWVRIEGALAEGLEAELIPAWEWIGEGLSEWGVEPPVRIGPEGPTRREGFVQRLPEDAALAVAIERCDEGLVLATALGVDETDDPWPAAVALLREDRDALAAAAGRYWSDIVERAPRVDLPDETLQRLYDYGLVRLAGCALSEHPHQPAAGLQGPFMEETALPPWSNDYHLNINVQMMYRPLLATNLLEGFAPLWRMLCGWIPQMRRRGESFYEQPGALMLHHASDDRCQVIGGLWIGTVDHGCCAWMARLAWLHYRYSGDRAVLRDVAWPLLVGAFEGYWGMARRETDADGNGRLTLDVSVSPEYHGSQGKPWGADASFQLAAWHSVTEALVAAAADLGEEQDPRWRQVSRELPPFTTIDDRPDLGTSGPSLRQFRGRSTDRRIAMWEGEDLAESHRHHSHMGAVYPFETIDPLDPALAEVIGNTYDVWTLRGAGFWTGWCLSWASILAGRYGQTTAAVAWLRLLAAGFSNEGGNTNHDAAPGLSVLTGRSAQVAAEGGREIIQLDAALGAVSAVLELLVQPRPDAVHVLPGLPVGWRNLSFDRVGCPGGFRIGATVRRARRVELRVHSTRGGTLTIAHHLGPAALVDGARREGETLRLETAPGQDLILRPVEAD